LIDNDWGGAAQAYLARLGRAEWEAFRKGRIVRTHSRWPQQFHPSPYHVQLMELLGKNDEEGFKALKMLQGYASAIGV
jgi:hypothetical protein